MSKPIFLFTGVYDTVPQAEQDYDAIKQLHDSGGRRGLHRVREPEELTVLQRNVMSRAKADHRQEGS
jgi:hypothetical protein